MNKKESIQHIFIIGAKSIGQYGGYETFVDKLTEQHQNETLIKYHIACKANGDGFMNEKKLLRIKKTRFKSNGEVTEFEYHNAHVFKIPCPKIGPAVAVYYDCAALKYCINYCRKNRIEHPIFYVLTCRIGLAINTIVRQIKSIGGQFFLNPDGHEWKRQKWNSLIRRYWKWSEKKMVDAADMIVCDSVNIEEYIKKEYRHPNTVFIAYGSDTTPSKVSDDEPEFKNWLLSHNLKKKEYYLIVGRFVPENNYEIMIREFLHSHSNRSLAIITNHNNKLYDYLEKKLHFSADARIKFVGTVYDKDLLKKIRECAYGYIHGHEVGGTNPSLLEALSSTDISLLLNVGFNREVGQNAALYWDKEEGSLASLLDFSDQMTNEEIEKLALAAKQRIKDSYSWQLIGEKYKRLWNEEKI